MKPILFIGSLILLWGAIFGEPSFAQEKHNNYRSYSSREMADILKDSCESGKMANCFELGQLYIENKNKDAGKKYIQKACQGGEEAACDYLQKDKSTGSALLFYSAIILIGISVLIITNMIFSDEDQYKASEKLEDSGKDEKSQYAAQGIVLKYSRPFFKRYISPIVSSMKSKKKIKEKYKRPLASAGLTDLMTPEDFFSFKLFLIVGFPIVFVFVREFMEENWSFKLIPVMAIVGYMYPNIWIKKKIEMRQAEVRQALPFAIDMLALSVEAGLDFIAAMTKVVEKARPSALTQEFEILIKEIKIGASRAEALRNLAWRLDLIETSSFCATLIAADSVGASIGPILKSLSGEIRQKKSAQAEKQGAKAATKILFPMMGFIVPAVFLIVAAPLIIQFINGG